MTEEKLDQIRGHLEAATRLLSELTSQEVIMVIDKEFLTREEAANILGIKKGTFSTYTCNGKINLHNYGSFGRPRFKKDEVEKLSKSQNPFERNRLNKIRSRI